MPLILTVLCSSLKEREGVKTASVPAQQHGSTLGNVAMMKQALRNLDHPSNLRLLELA